jgi:hypothetical protein
MNDASTMIMGFVQNECEPLHLCMLLSNNNDIEKKGKIKDTKFTLL